MFNAVPWLARRTNEVAPGRLVRAAILLLLGLCVAMGAAISDIYLHRGIEAGDESPVVLHPTGRLLSTNLDLTIYAPEQIEPVATVLQTSGFGMVRQPFDWKRIEPAKGQFQWEMYDNIVSVLTDHGIGLTAVLAGSPDWARAPAAVGYPDAPPVNVDDYGAFVNAFVDHFHDKIQIVQLWDLPNRPERWGGVPAAPGDYLRLLAAGFNGARAANSEVRVLLAEIDPAPPGDALGADVRFLSRLYDAGGAAFFDIVTARIDGGSSSPYDRKVSSNRLNLSRAILFRELMVKHGDQAKPLWLSHYGWSSANGQLTEQERADFTVAGFRRARAEWPWMGLMFAWGLLPSSDPAEAGMSLLDASGGATPAFDAVTAFGQSGAAGIASTGFVPMDSRPVAYSGTWEDQHLLHRTFRTTSETGASATLTFRGTGVTAVLRQSGQAGPVYVTIDGKPLPGHPVKNGAAIIYLDFFTAQDVPMRLASGLQDGDHVLKITLADAGQLTIGGLIVSRDPPLLWPVVLLLVIAGGMMFVALRDVVYVVATQAGYLQRREGIELRPPLPRLPDWRPAPRYR